MSTSTASTAAQRPVTAYLPQGRFGHAVVERLAGPQDAVLPVDHGLVYASVPYADRLVMVADADRTALREALDEVSFTRSVPSLGLETGRPLLSESTICRVRLYNFGQSTSCKPPTTRSMRSETRWPR